jgi:ribosomal protein L11 methyltransferase
MVEPYVCIELQVQEEQTETAYALLSVLPISGIEEGEASLKLYIPSREWQQAEDQLRALVTTYPFMQVVAVHELAPHDWHALWVAQLQPVWLADGILVHPYPTPPDPGMYPTARVVLHIVPGIAFGSGHHASTRLAARLLLCSVSPGSRWLDIGTGSGILGILAAQLGASRVYAIDNNPYAVHEAQENAIRNAVADRMHIWYADVTAEEPFPFVDGVVANLHAELLQRIAPRLAGLVPSGGIAIFSGILEVAVDSVRRAYATFFEEVAAERENEWVALALRRH